MTDQQHAAQLAQALRELDELADDLQGKAEHLERTNPGQVLGLDLQPYARALAFDLQTYARRVASTRDYLRELEP